MTCNVLRDRRGNVLGIACDRRRNRRRCQVAGCGQVAGKQCDYPAPSRRSGTCDMYLCAAHATPQQTADTDYCPTHAQQTDVQPLASANALDVKRRAT